MSSPKASLHMLYAHSEKQPKYETKPVLAAKESADNGLVVSAAFLVKPLSLQQSGYSCTLFLPDYPPVVSDVFPKKKEAEQDAAKKALEQMGKSFIGEDSSPKILSAEEKVAALTERIEAIFSEKVVMSCQPLKEHFRAAMKRKDERSGMVSVAALAALDNRIYSLCKSLHASSDSDPVFAVAMVWEAARRSPVLTCEQDFLIKKIEPFSSQFQAEFLSSEVQGESFSKFQAVYIPSFEEAMVTNMEIELEPHGYYMDVLAKKLGLEDGAGIMISRTIPRAPHDTRLYCAIPDILPKTNTLSEFVAIGNATSEGLCGLKSPGKVSMARNKRASDLLGFSVHGDAILANVGSSWKSEGKLLCADVSLSCYYRLLLGRTPEGNYKLSRYAILVAKLPCSFSSRLQWRGKLPRLLLIDFCHQHRLPDPEFSFSLTKASGGMVSDDKEKDGTGNTSYKCMAKIVDEGKAIEFESERLYRNRNDAAQSAALQALLFLSKKADAVYENPQKSGVCRGQQAEAVGLHERAESLSMPKNMSASRACVNGVHVAKDQGFKASDRGQSDSNKIIVAGSIVSISCDVWLVGYGTDVKVEAHEEFEFELGIGGIIAELENAVLGMQVGGYEQLSLSVPSLESVLATHEDAISGFDESNMGLFSLRYVFKVLRSLEPPEERMESALFSPPLSKQRNEFAIHKIKEVNAKSLVDLGCGSGSLLDAVVDHSTDLEHIAGVDISLKSLLRAAKSLNTKLGLHETENNGSFSNKLKGVVLYEGSLAEPDPRLCGFDVATCIEVVEHMDPEPLSKAGEIILGTYTPQTLILSTPNIEYNVILQKITADAKTNSGECKDKPSTCLDLYETTPSEDAMDDNHKASLTKHDQHHAMDTPALTNESQSIPLSDDDSNTQSIKLRNDDHRFEWTRVEFAEWADNLASRFGYTVEYAGVGGSVEDPGFASQIAIFTRKSHADTAVAGMPEMDDQGGWEQGVQKGLQERCNSPCYREVWKYDKGGLPLESA